MERSYMLEIFRAQTDICHAPNPRIANSGADVVHVIVVSLFISSPRLNCRSVGKIIVPALELAAANTLSWSRPFLHFQQTMTRTTGLNPQ
jgi:hypothetical protein